MYDRLFDRAAPFWPEAGLAVGALVLLGAAAFGAHVVHGGFYFDDWTIYEMYGTRGLSAVDFSFERPLTKLTLWLTQSAFGLDFELHLAYTLATAVLASVAFYFFLRALRIEPVHAGAIAALALIFPWADSTKFWSVLAPDNLAIALYFGGVVMAIRGLSRSGRAAVAMHAIAVLMYVASILLYEIAGALVLVSVALYATQAPLRSCIPRWLADVGAGGGALLAVGLSTTRPIRSLLVQFDHARRIADEGLTILARAAFPFQGPGRAPILALLAAAAAAVVVARGLPYEDPGGREIRRWLWVAAGAAAGTALGYGLIVPADPYWYYPLFPGTGNRINVLAAFGYVTLVYALAMATGLALFRLVRGARHVRYWATGFAVAVAGLIGVGYWMIVSDDRAAWRLAWAEQQRVLSSVREQLPDPPRGSTIYTFGHAGDSAPGVTIFGATWDLDSAVRLNLGRPSLHAYPILEGTRFECGRDRLYPVNGFRAMGEAHGSRYRRAFFVDVSREIAVRIDTRAECRIAARSFDPGPAVLESS